MPTTGHGERRYPKHSPTAGPRMVVRGVDLGAAMTPQDVLIAVRIAFALPDAEILEAVHAGADRVERDLGPDPYNPDAPALRELSVDDRRAVIAVARATTMSGVVGWRRRNREMTWPELRVLLLGLRETGR